MPPSLYKIPKEIFREAVSEPDYLLYSKIFLQLPNCVSSTVNNMKQKNLSINILTIYTSRCYQSTTVRLLHRLQLFTICLIKYLLNKVSFSIVFAFLYLRCFLRRSWNTVFVYCPIFSSFLRARFFHINVWLRQFLNV